MLMMIIHELGYDKCVVVVKLLCFYDFCENGTKVEKFDFYEFERIDDDVVLN
jgi:hypothetical protein